VVAVMAVTNRSSPMRKFTLAFPGTISSD